MGNVKDPVVRAFWINEYEEWKEQFRNEAIAPIQNKVGQFLSTPLVRNIVGQSKSTIDIGEIMNSGKIFLVNVSKGRIGEDNSALLGAMLITKIQLAAMERVRIPEEERVDFYLYVDEFQNFATDSFANILSEARKYYLNLILAHQYIGQLVTDASTKVRDAVFGNVGTMVTFRVGAADAGFLEKEFEPEFGVQDMVNLPNYHIYLKLLVGGVRSRPFSATTLPPLALKTTGDIVERVIQNSRKKYARPRWVVENEITEWSGTNDEAKNAVDCMNCGKHVKLPFTPTPGRPVYCPECYAKVKSGEIEPVRVSAQPAAESSRKTPRGADELARHAVVQETGGSAGETPRAPEKSYSFFEKKQSQGPSRPARKQSVLHERPSTQRAAPPVSEERPAVSLRDLSAAPAKEEKPRTRATQDISELRKSLDEALGKLKK